MEATSGPTRVVFQLLNAPANLELNAGMRFAVGLLGAVSIGWSMTLFAAIRLATSVDKRTAAPFWTLLTLSIAGWFLIDSAISIYTGFWRNSVSNVLIVGTFLLPLLRSRVFSAKE